MINWKILSNVFAIGFYTYPCFLRVGSRGGLEMPRIELEPLQCKCNIRPLYYIPRKTCKANANVNAKAYVKAKAYANVNVNAYANVKARANLKLMLMLMLMLKLELMSKLRLKLKLKLMLSTTVILGQPKKQLVLIL